MEYFDVDGFFLVNSPQRATSSRCDTPQGAQYWIDWWTREEIENHLTRHRELLTVLPGVVSADLKD